MLSKEQYYKLQTQKFLPLDIKININDFEKEIKPYHNKFRQWGEERTHLQRYGISLINETGSIDEEIDPTCYPLDQYNKQYNDDYCSNYFTVPTEILKLPSLLPLKPLFPYLIRSNILWWNKEGGFVDHTDMGFPTNLLRLWGTNKKDYVWEYGDERMVFEPGRIYSVDASITHRAYAQSDFTYTFFLACNIKAYDTIQQHILLNESSQPLDL